MDIADRLIKENWLCSLATTNGSMPHCTLMAYVAAPSLRHIYLVTKPDSIKYNNIRSNSNVSILIDNRKILDDDPFSVFSLTIFGSASIVEDEIFAATIKEQFLSQNQILKSLASGKQSQIIEVKLLSVIVSKGPSDGTYSDLSKPKG